MAKHYSGTIPPCSIIKGCEAVTTQPIHDCRLARRVREISVALLGASYYLVILIISHAPL